MKRSNFLKSFLIGIVAPKVVVDAMNKPPPELARHYGDTITLDKYKSRLSFSDRDPNAAYVKLDFTGHNKAHEIIQQLIAKNKTTI